jgi:hypothetical protein
VLGFSVWECVWHSGVAVLCEPVWLETVGTVMLSRLKVDHWSSLGSGGWGKEKREQTSRERQGGKRKRKDGHVLHALLGKRPRSIASASC